MTSTVPTAQELSGDFSNPAIFNTSVSYGTNPCDGTPIYQGQIFDPSTTRTVTLPGGGTTECRTAYPGNKITGGFSPVMSTILGYFPAPTNNLVFNNYQFKGVAPITDTAETIRIDSNLSQKNRIWGSYSSRENDRVSGTPTLPYPIDPGSWIQDFTTHFGRFGWDYVISPSMLNHFIFGSNRSNSVNYAQAIFAGINWSQKFGIGNANSLNFPEITNGFTAQESNAPQNDDNVDNGLNNTSNFSPTAMDPEYGVPGALVFGTICHCNTAWANSYWKDIAPRIGFAYTPPAQNGKTAIRGGAGILYGPLPYSDFGGSMNTGYRANPTFPSKNGFDPSFVIDNGYPAFSQPPDLDPGYFNGTFVSGSWIRPEYGKPAAIYQWDLQVQQQLATDLIATIGYIGNEAQNLHSNLENRNNISINDLNYGTHLNDHLLGNTDGVAVPFPGYFALWGNGITVQQALRPFPQYDFIDIHENLALELKFEFINALNHHTWSYPDQGPADPTFGIPTSTLQNPRNIQVTGKLTF